MPHDVYRLAQLSIALSAILLVLSAAKRKKSTVVSGDSFGAECIKHR